MTRLRRAHLLLLLLMLGVVGCDQASKEVAEHRLRGQEPVDIVAGAVDLQYAQNRGVAFNAERFLPEGARGPLMYLGAMTALLMVGVAWFRRWRQPSIEHLAYALLVGGAVGNLIDRFHRGYVVDFVHVHGWPIFNVADMAICLGVGVLLLRVWHHRGGGDAQYNPERTDNIHR